MKYRTELRMLMAESEKLRKNIQQKLDKPQRTFLVEREDLHRINHMLQALEPLAMATYQDSDFIAEQLVTALLLPNDIPEAH